MHDYKTKYMKWCESPCFDENTKNELRAITDEKEIEDRFYKDLEFGTAGLRGVMGAGTNRMNRYTVGKATLGLANFLLAFSADARRRGVAIGYDTRNNSAAFAKNAADVLTAKGIRVYLFNQPVPTPLLSFTVKNLGCVSGIVVTASHNPPAYNGYKAYDEFGCQLGVELAKKVIAEVNAVSDYAAIPTAGDNSLLETLGDAMITRYITAVLKQSTLRDEAAKKALKIVYTPLHGTGNIPVRQALETDGFSGVSVVREQELPDGNFSTVKSPNPEEHEALFLGMEMAKKIGADLVIGTDPDADRIGCAVKTADGMRLLSGNQVGALLTDFILKTKTVLGQNPILIKTIVTSDLGAEIAKKHGCGVTEVLTGFKFIGEKITQYEAEQASGDKNCHHFVFGYEESYGYLAGTHARDKDAVVTSMLICEMAAFHKKAGKTLADALDGLFAEYGTYLDTTESFTLPGKDGLARIAEIMADFRRDHSFLHDVVKTLDYAEGIENFPKSDVLKFFLKGGSWLAVRPSGTEPKIKVYYSIRESSFAKAEETQALLKSLIYKAMKLCDRKENK